MWTRVVCEKQYRLHLQSDKSISVRLESPHGPEKGASKVAIVGEFTHPTFNDGILKKWICINPYDIGSMSLSPIYMEITGVDRPWHLFSSYLAKVHGRKRWGNVRGVVCSSIHLSIWMFPKIGS